MFGAMLAGCASPTSVKFARSTFSSLDTETVFVATNRKAIAKSDFDGERGEKIQFSSYAISIPPIHEVGQIEWPRNEPDPAKHFAVIKARPFSETAGFKQHLNVAIDTPGARTVDGKREAILFVHGYNTNFSEGLYRAAQMKHDFGITSPMTLFSWPSAGKPGLYMYDRDSVKASRDQLADVVRMLTNSKAEQVTLVAHSLGTELLMEALRQMALSNDGRLPAKVKAVILISPDLDIDVFNSQLQVIKTLPRDFMVFVSEKDQALQISSFLAGDTNRVGNNIDETRIKRDGINVIDVSEFDGGDGLNHMTAITSPSLVSLLKGMAQSGQRKMLSESGLQTSLSDKLVDTATLPLTLVVKTTKAILNQ
jgi:esterase/lipase superfamily enzyme